MPSIFISYRRSDSQDVTERIYDRLASHFGEEALFKDAENIPVGEDIPKFLNRVLDECKVLLAIIGPTWLNAIDAQGNDQGIWVRPNDWVLMEIEAALRREDLRVVPLIVGDVSMPRPDDLPDSIRELANLHGLFIRHDPDFNEDVQRLIRQIELLVSPAQQPPQPRNGPQSFLMQRILFLAASPTNPTRLQLDEELRDIEQGLRRAQRRDQFTLAQRRAVRPRDIQRVILEETPQIVHFSGHSGEQEGLVFEDETGKLKLVSGEALANLFALFADSAGYPDPIRCVVLDGCYSEVQAKAIAEYVPYVIGISRSMGDHAAIEFAIGFYNALVEGETVEFAFQLSGAAISIAGQLENTPPIIIHKRSTPAISPSSSSIPENRSKLYQLLLGLPSPQFEAVLFDLNPPRGNISPASAPQGQRVSELFSWLESIDPGLETLRISLKRDLANFLETDEELLPDRKPHKDTLVRDRYRITRVLEQGGYGIKYLAQDIKISGEPYCVIKHLHVEEQSKKADDLAKRRLRVEAKTLRRLGNHPQIPQLLDYFESNNDLYLVQEHIQGKALSQRIRHNEQLTEREAISFLEKVLPALRHLHSHEVIHRNIKPSNIIYSESKDRIFLVDLDAAKDFSSSLDSESKDSRLLLQLKQSKESRRESQNSLSDEFSVSTPGFAPPEQMALEPTYASDIYALGVTCICLLTSLSPKDFDYDVFTGELLWTDLIDISPGFRQVIQKMIKVNVTERYQSVEALEKDLKRLNDKSGSKTRIRNVIDEVPDRARSLDYYNICLKSPLESILIGSEFEVCVGLGLEPNDQVESLEIQVHKHDAFGKELNLLLSSSDFQISGSSEASLPLASDLLSTQNRETKFHLTALRSGSLKLSLEVYLDDEFKGKIQRTLDVQGLGDNREFLSKQLIRSRPVSPPDLMLQIQDCSGGNSGIQLSCRLTNFTSINTLDESLSSSKVFQADLAGKFRHELSLTAEKAHAGVSQSKDQLAALSSLGQTLFQRLLPQDIQDELRSVRRFSRPASLMILADQATWLPWEIMHDGQHFLGDRFILGRWPLEISDKRPYEFAIGSVKLAHYADVERPEMWLDLLEPPGSMPPSVMQQGIFEDLGLAEVLQGLHLVRQGESRNDMDERVDAPVVIQEAHTADGVEEQLRPGKLNLRRNRPVVSLGYLQNGHKELTNIETAWVPAFLKAGCSAFVGSLWSVRPEVEAAFISNFYSNLWAGNNLGLAFYKAKQMARVAVPESVDWLAYVLYGDPMARPYRPVEGRGYAVVEAVGHDLDQPVAVGSTLRFRAGLRRKPPIWYENRLMDVTEALNFADLKVYIVASGIEVNPSDCIEMRRTPDGDYLGWFNLSMPSGLAGQTILVQVHFEDGDDPIQSQRMTLKVAEA